jgi:hypothetical protein
MTTQPENKNKAEQKVSKDELSEKELEKASGGATHADLQIVKRVDKTSHPELLK